MPVTLVIEEISGHKNTIYSPELAACVMLMDLHGIVDDTELVKSSKTSTPFI